MIPTTAKEKEQYLELIYNIERRLRRKERIYIFSKQGHGRAGKGSVICAITVERPEETTANILKPKLLTTSNFKQLSSTLINY